MAGVDEDEKRQGALALRESSQVLASRELWFVLARRGWRSVVFVPVDRPEYAVEAARSLAQVGRQLHEFPVILFVMNEARDYWPAAQMVATAASGDPEPPADIPESSTTQELVATPGRHAGATGKVIVAVQPVITEPLGLAVVQAADLVILCLEKGETRLADTRRTIELVGRERIAGCVLIR